MRKLIRDRNLHDIAAAIRTKNGSNGTYKPREMADAIRALPSPSTLISKTITQNGSYSPQSENADGFSSVTVNVGRNLVRKDITRNGSFSAASDHVDGYSSVSVNVPNSYSALDEGKVVSSGTLTPQTSLSVTQNGTFDTTRNNQVTVNVSGGSTLVSKTITANGTYLPENDNADGFDCVSVAVPRGFDATDEGKVVQNGTLMPQTSLNVSANGTYDTTAKNSVVVNVSVGGNSSGNSSEASPNIQSVSLLNSTAANILFELAMRPLSGSNALSSFSGSMADLITENRGLYFENNRTLAYDLGAVNTSCTLYAVVAAKATGSFYYLLGSVSALSDNKAPGFAVSSNRLYATVYGSYTDYDTGLTIVNSWHVIAIALDGVNKSASFFVDGQKKKTTSFLESGRYAAINSAYPTGERFSKAEYAYFAGVSGVESDETIVANHSILMNHFSDLFATS